MKSPCLYDSPTAEKSRPTQGSPEPFDMQNTVAPSLRSSQGSAVEPQLDSGSTQDRKFVNAIKSLDEANKVFTPRRAPIMGHSSSNNACRTTGQDV